MKTLFVVRHAKSSWGDLTASDFDRPLNDRGKRNAPEMALRMLSRWPVIDLFISSSAKRAMETAGYFAEAYHRAPAEIQVEDGLYHAPPSAYFEIISKLPDKHRSIIIFGHNPGITVFVNQLTEVTIDSMPTCGVFAVSASCERWADFAVSPRKFLFFDAPKIT